MLIYPILIEPCDWQKINLPERVQIRPEDHIPLSEKPNDQIENEISNFVLEIADLLNIPLNQEPDSLPESEEADTEPGGSRLIKVPSDISKAKTEGRNTDLYYIEELFNKNPNVISIEGSAGCGKTNFIKAFLYQLQLKQYEWGELELVYYYSFRNDPTVRPFLRRLYLDLNLDPEQFSISASLVEILVNQLLFRRALLILDDLQKIQSGSGQIRSTILRMMIESLGRSNNGTLVLISRSPITNIDPEISSTFEKIVLEPLDPSLINEPPPSPTEAIPSFTADKGGRNLLQIDDDVRALSYLIAARDTKPPLAVGLFGDWGSGKSFFMEQVIKKVQDLADQARKSGDLQRDCDFYKRIVQIEFNAWHYVGGNLWASLVEHIFGQLSTTGDEAEKQIEERRKYWIQQIEDEEDAGQRALEARRKAEETLRAARQAKVKLDEQHRREMQNLTLKKTINLWKTRQIPNEIVGQAKETIRQFGGDTALDNAQQFYDALKDTQELLKSGNALLTPIFKSEEGWKSVLKIVPIVVAAPLAGYLIWLAITYFKPEANFADATAWLGGVITFLGTAAGWIKKQTAWVRNQFSRIEEVKSQIKRAVEDKEKVNQQRIKRDQERIAAIEEQMRAAERQAEEASQRIEEAKSELRKLEPDQLLASFIADRARSEDYRQHLGITALIHRDFKRLSDLIEKQNKWLLKDVKSLPAEQQKEQNRINRIILYIDDLDRCPPATVIEVLRAVHLLLAFPLFVVVVAVDARWVSKALYEEYKGLLHPGWKDGSDVENPLAEGGHLEFGREATPLDYLEKIFQIPFWLNKIEADGARRLLEGLLEPIVRKTEAEKPPVPRTPPEGVDEGISEDEAEPVLEEDEVVDEGDEGEEDFDHADLKEDEDGRTADEAGDEEPQPEEKINRAALQIIRNELKFMVELTPLLGRSPRAVKRFTNVYRLIKAGLPPDVHTRLMDESVDPAGYKVVLFLLAIVTGTPDICRPIFLKLIRIDQGDKPTDIFQVKEDLEGEQIDDSTRLSEKTFFWLWEMIAGEDKVSELADWTRMTDWLNRDDNIWKNQPLDKLLPWAAKVARYSFRVEQV